MTMGGLSDRTWSGRVAPVSAAQILLDAELDDGVGTPQRTEVTCKRNQVRFRVRA